MAAPLPNHLSDLTTLKRPLVIVWLLLIALTTLGYFTRGGLESGEPLFHAVPLLTSMVKLALVGWVFMELHTVTRLWAFGLSILLTGIFCMVILMRFPL